MDDIEYLATLEPEGRTLDSTENEEWLVHVSGGTDISATVSQELQELIESSFTDLEDGSTVIVRVGEKGYIVTMDN